MSPLEIIRHFVERWTIEVTFEESKRFLAVESTRNRKKESVLRSFPLLMGLFSLISLWYFDRFKKQPKVTTAQAWYPKTQPTFADAISTMRKEIWDQNLFSIFAKNHNMQKMPRTFPSWVSLSWAVLNPEKHLKSSIRIRDKKIKNFTKRVWDVGFKINETMFGRRDEAGSDCDVAILRA